MIKNYLTKSKCHEGSTVNGTSRESTRFYYSIIRNTDWAPGSHVWIEKFVVLCADDLKIILAVYNVQWQKGNNKLYNIIYLV